MIERDDTAQVGGTHGQAQHSWARIPGSARRSKMSDSKQARSQDCQNEEADRSSASSPPLSSCPLLSSPLPSSPLPLEVGPLNPARGSGARCKLPQRGLGRSPSRNRFWCILALVATILMIFLRIN